MPLERDDVRGSGVLTEHLPIYKVGWLGDFLPAFGEVEASCINLLFQAFVDQQIILDGTDGWHDCELCDGKEDWYPEYRIGPVVHWRGKEARIRGYGHFIISTGQKIYMAPVLVLHYILDHGYKPPTEFVDVIEYGTFLGMDDLKWIET